MRQRVSFVRFVPLIITLLVLQSIAIASVAKAPVTRVAAESVTADARADDKRLSAADFIGISQGPDPHRLYTFNSDGSVKTAKTLGKGYFYDFGRLKDGRLLIAENPDGGGAILSVRLYDPGSDRITGKYRLNTAGEAMAVCDDKIYSVNLGLGSPDTGVYVYSAVTGKRLGRYSVPHKNPDTARYLVVIGPITCLADGRVAVRSLESQRPNNLVDRIESIFILDPDTGAFSPVFGPRLSHEQLGFQQLSQSATSGDFYGYEMWPQGEGFSHRIAAFKAGRASWGQTIDVLPMQRLSLGPEEDGRISASIVYTPRRGYGGHVPLAFRDDPAFQKARERREAEEERIRAEAIKRSRLLVFDGETGRLIKETPVAPELEPNPDLIRPPFPFSNSPIASQGNKTDYEHVEVVDGEVTRTTVHFKVGGIKIVPLR